MNKELENYKTITVFGLFNKSPTCTSTIYCEFQSDEIVLKSIEVYDTDIVNEITNGELMFLIRSSMVDNQILYHFTHQTVYEDLSGFEFNQVCSSPNAHNLDVKFKTPNLYNGQHSFTLSVVNINGIEAAPTNASTLDTTFVMTFEFRKYKK